MTAAEILARMHDRPPKDHEYSGFVEELADETTFEFTGQHPGEEARGL